MATPERVLRPLPLDKRAHSGRLQGHLRRGQNQCRSSCPQRNLLFSVHTGEQEQVPVMRLHVDDLEVDVSVAAGEMQVEVLAASVGADVVSYLQNRTQTHTRLA